ncbi:hypothetical protein AGR1B_pa0036 [Agrobacterium fabacearum S56]|nr:hypothetical protein AGR1B_pa0036 [Agrobacterium fabacearum S56]
MSPIQAWYHNQQREEAMQRSREPPKSSRWLRSSVWGLWALCIHSHWSPPDDANVYPLIRQLARPLRSRWGMSDQRPPRDALLDRHPQRPGRFLPLCAEAPIPRETRKPFPGRPPLRFGLSGAGRSPLVQSTAIEAAMDAARTTEKEYDNGNHGLFHRFQQRLLRHHQDPQPQRQGNHPHRRAHFRQRP